jgi:SAM-dependent methyltransferase
MHSSAFALLLALAACSTAPPQASGAGSNVLSQTNPSPSTTATTRQTQRSAYLASLNRDAQALRPQFQQAVALGFLDQAQALPNPLPRPIHAQQKTGQLITPEAWAQLPAADQAAYTLKDSSDELYYSTYYGNPLAYARAVEVLGANGLSTLTNKRVLDIGYGAIAAPRMMASVGAHVHAVDVDPSLTALYRDANDQGVIANAGSSVRGTLTLHEGVYASNPQVMKGLTIDGARGTAQPTPATKGFDVIVSKNTMKRGFMKPAPDKKAFVSFGVSDEVLLQTIHDSLAPGGLFLIYNVAGRLDAARPSTDGHSPFTAAQFAQAQLTVLALDQSDDDGLRALGRVLGWETPMGDLNSNLFGLYTLLKRP